MEGIVTNLKIGCYEALDSIGSRTDRYSLSSLTKSIVSSFAMLGCGDRMAAGLKTESIADLVHPTGIFVPRARLRDTPFY